MAPAIPYTLRTGLTFCSVDGRLLFLDVPADRYFCLAEASEQAFRHLYQGHALDAADDARLGGLISAGLLVDDDGSRPIAPCRPPRKAIASLLEADGAQPRAREVAVALLYLWRVRIELRLAGLERTFVRVQHCKRGMRAQVRPAGIAATAAAFEACAEIVSAHNRCLPRSIAIAHRLMRAGAAPDVIVAVKLGPFKAHAWVQCGDTLINERLEVTRLFTPILVL
jgi:hypothetical protein